MIDFDVYKQDDLVEHLEKLKVKLLIALDAQKRAINDLEVALDELKDNLA